MLDIFTNLNLLWFLPLAAAPIVLHLITLYRLRTLELSTFRFLMDSYVQQRRKLRLLEFLLMLLRTAFVVLIVAALARPTVDKFGFLFGPKAAGRVAIVVDAGPSMTLRTGGTTSLERARAVACNIVRLYGADSRISVIRAADRPEAMVNRFASDPRPIVEQIGKIEAGAVSTDLAAALEHVFGPADDAPQTVYLITDGRRSTWRGLAGRPVLKRIEPRTTVAVVNVGPTEPVANLAVVGDRPSELRSVVRLPVLLGVTVVNSSAEQSANAAVSVMLDDEQAQRLNISLQPGQRVTRPVTVTPTRSGLIRGRFGLPADAFPDDDAFLFTLNVRPSLSVLVVAQESGGKAREQSGSYLRAALEAPLLAVEQFSEAERQLAEALKVKTVPPGQLTTAVLARADTVILADVSIDAPRGGLLTSYVKGGGGLLVLPGAHSNPDGYRKHLLGPLLAEPVGDPDNEASFAPVSGIDRTHPVFDAFADPERRYFATVRLFRYFPIQAPAVANAPGPLGSGRVLMRSTGRVPVLVESALGEGKLLVAGFPATPDWSNLPLKPEFVPMLLRAVAYLQRPAQAHTPATVRPGQPAPIRLTGQWPRAQVQVVDPTGKPHTIEMHRSGEQFVGAMLQTNAKGYYEVNVLPRADAAPERVELGFAVNVDSKHTDFEMVDEQQIRNVFGSRPVTYLSGVPDDPVLVERLGRKRPLWRLLIAATFVIILVEFLLATPRGAPSDDETDRGVMARWAGAIAAAMNRSGLWVSLPSSPARQGEQPPAPAEERD